MGSWAPGKRKNVGGMATGRRSAATAYLCACVTARSFVPRSAATDFSCAPVIAHSLFLRLFFLWVACTDSPSPRSSFAKALLRFSLLGTSAVLLPHLKVKIHANTSFFHRQCTYRRQKNRVHSLLVEGQILTEHDEMAQAVFAHFDVLLGTAPDRAHTLDLEHHIMPADLTSVEVPFSPEEIWEAVRRMPAHKALGPDGFSAEFLRACWSIIKQDILEVFELLYALRGADSTGFNQVLLFFPLPSLSARSSSLCWLLLHSEWIPK
ncbi:Serine/threonine-protein kinase SMG1 [Hordeum vulgare]|nr:Serine/threonine-protein kinase SMG1 [Hordeum vulgare]